MASAPENQNVLALKKCIPCAGGIEPLKDEAVKELLAKLNDGWQVVKEHHFEKQYKFKDFSKPWNSSTKSDSSPNRWATILISASHETRSN